MQRSVSSLFVALFLFSVVSPPVGAQTPPAQPAQSSSPLSSAQSTADLLKPGQIDALVAPIALYPDALLSQVLIASTYPLEVVEGARWLKANSNLTGDALKVAIEKQPWDNSIKSLAATPSVLETMSDKLDWTQRLGDAVLAQQADVMDGIQRLRARADANNKLETNEQQKVIKTKENNRDVIVIEPAKPDTVYVPYYEPAVVYGGWPYPDYPPYYWGAPGYIAAGVIATGIAFGTAYAIGRWATGGWGWGGGFAWGNNNINFNRQININNRNNFISGQTWHHNPDHRHGVAYHNAAVRQRFSGNRTPSGRANQLNLRDHNGQRALRPNTGARTGNRSDRAGRNMSNHGRKAANHRARSNVGHHGRANAVRRGPRNLGRAGGMRGRAGFHGRAMGGARFHARGGGGFRRR